MDSHRIPFKMIDFGMHSSSQNYPHRRQIRIGNDKRKGIMDY